MTRPPLASSARGSTLVLTMVLLAVLSLVAVAAVTLTNQERTNTNAMARRDLQIACAHAARMVVFAELARHGSQYLRSADYNVASITLADGTVLSHTHYDTPAGMKVVDVSPLRTVSVSGKYRASGDLTNTFNTPGGLGNVNGNAVVARCQDPKGRDLEIEFFVAFPL